MPKINDWGQRVDTRELRDIFAPTEVKPFTATPGGIDNLALSSIDTFLIPGRGEFEVKFQGYFRVARSNPTSRNWGEAEWYVNMIELGLVGNAPGLGEVKVSLNKDVVSPGQVFAAKAFPGKVDVPAPPQPCRIAGAAMFHVSSMGVELFNKEPILLMNNGITAVPPVEDPNGEAHIYMLPLFSVKEPDGKAVGYLMRLRYTVGNYITRDQLTSMRQRMEAR